MASGFGNFVQSIFEWFRASDYRYREACRMMEIDDNILDDIGITREELMAELGIRRLHGTKVHPLGRRETNYWSGMANRRMARGSL